MSHISHIIIVYTENKYQGRCTLTRKYTEIIICLSYISVETGHMALWIVQQKKKRKKFGERVGQNVLLPEKKYEQHFGGKIIIQTYKLVIQHAMSRDFPSVA